MGILGFSRPPLPTLAILSAYLLLAGCALGRSVVPVDADAGSNPSQGTALRIAAAEDARVFMVAAPSHETQSLVGDDIGNQALTSRVLALKRNTFGTALGDVVLPEGVSVAALVQAAVTRGLRESGYRVLTAGDAGYDQAVPISLRVEEFWSWFEISFFVVTVRNRSRVAVQGAIPPLAQGRTFSARAETSAQIVTESDWLAVVTKGLEALAAAVRDGVRQP